MTSATASSPSLHKKAPWSVMCIALTFTERELADTEKRLEEASLQELAATCRVVEELQAAWAIETQKV
jgi:hypothetical protein